MKDIIYLPFEIKLRIISYLRHKCKVCQRKYILGRYEDICSANCWAKFNLGFTTVDSAIIAILNLFFVLYYSKIIFCNLNGYDRKYKFEVLP